MAKIGTYLKYLVEAVAALCAALFGARLLRRSEPECGPQVKQARDEQQEVDREAQQDRDRQAAIEASEREQAALQVQAQTVDQKIAAEKHRIEGLDRDAVIEELRHVSDAPAAQTAQPAKLDTPKS